MMSLTLKFAVKNSDCFEAGSRTDNQRTVPPFYNGNFHVFIWSGNFPFRCASISMEFPHFTQKGSACVWWFHIQYTAHNRPSRNKNFGPSKYQLFRRLLSVFLWISVEC